MDLAFLHLINVDLFMPVLMDKLDAEMDLADPFRVFVP